MEPRLEHVPARTRLDRALDVVVVVVHGEHNDLAGSTSATDSARNLNAPKLRHFDVQNKDVRAQSGSLGEGLCAVADRGNDFVISQEFAHFRQESCVIVGK